MAVGLRAASALGDGRRLQPVDEVVESSDELTVADRVDLVEVAGDRLVDHPPVVGHEARGLALDQAGLPLADPSGPQQRERLGQVVAQETGQAHLPPPSVRRDPSRECDLVANATALSLCRLAAPGGVCALGAVEVGRHLGHARQGTGGHSTTRSACVEPEIPHAHHARRRH